MPGKRYANPTYLVTCWPRSAAENGHLMCAYPWEVLCFVLCGSLCCFEAVRA